MPAIRDANELILPDVERTIANLAELPPIDAGALQLARRYARLIDDAAPPARYGESLRYIAGLIDLADDKGRRHLQRIIDALSAHSVLSDLGPKLLDVLDTLGATPHGRVILKPLAKGVGGGRLAALRDSRAR